MKMIITILIFFITCDVGGGGGGGRPAILPAPVNVVSRDSCSVLGWMSTTWECCCEANSGWVWAIIPLLSPSVDFLSGFTFATFRSVLGFGIMTKECKNVIRWEMKNYRKSIVFNCNDDNYAITKIVKLKYMNKFK